MLASSLRTARPRTSAAHLLSRRSLLATTSRGGYAVQFQHARFHNHASSQSTIEVKPGATTGYTSQTINTPRSSPRSTADTAVLAKLPTPSLFRNLLIQNISSYPRLLTVLLGMLKRYTTFFITAPVFKHVLHQAFYAHYCAGATIPEITRTVRGLQQLGYKGVILNYAKEVDMHAAGQANEAERQKVHEEQVGQWLEGTLKTIEGADGAFAAIKFSGAGLGVVHMLEENREVPDEIFGKALTKMCEAAKARGVKLLIDAEHASQQKAIDKWTMDLMEKYNKGSDLVVYNTYQMYLKASSQVLAEQLQLAENRNFNFGAKLVRGAYLGSDPRHLIHDTKSETDTAYDTAAHMLGTYHERKPGSQTHVAIVLATHNANSANLMRTLRAEQQARGLRPAEAVYGQLMGMADELSLSLTTADEKRGFRAGDCDVYKYVTWGTTAECVLYLVRRAEENRDAVGGARGVRGLFWDELKRRFGLKKAASSAA
ncbi:uncharacterized protein K452DRAFT_234288 [Aplosporella prunicola CBS 121167]|uniref:Proline dehydrogenase n=1 Tax=Aplosporella prunicola CBS 121167 TaxID=1176127 RepID=A0A6A6B3P7_9PEZI|nr:uncharacterized protein K452DRAFT_234288 [Aplosporella prunicola CBS 121167]KAF2138228.1 hypothetical protein K452DRAFT_234288 [Aplosporella prunicola CBS 121167]